MARYTAVLVVHGMGNQRPLETLRAAADALYTSDPRFEGKELWLGMGSRGDSDRDIDLPHLITDNIAPPGQTPHYVEFHECYWAHLMGEVRFVAVPLWIFELVKKGPARMEPRVRPLWYVVSVLFGLWILAGWYLLLGLAALWTGGFPAEPWGTGLVLGGASAIAYFTMGWRGLAVQLAGQLAGLLAAWALWLAGCIPDLVLAPRDPVLSWTALGLIGLFVAFNLFFLLTVAGDAARYYRATPANIEVRRSIRTLARKRLEALNGNAKYQRVVVVAHSLGSVIAYDMLRSCWSEIANGLGDPSKDAACDEQDRARDGASFDLAAWRRGADAVRAALPGLPLRPKKAPPRWVVSDFVTVGSPLSQARFLMAEGTSASQQENSFARKIRERELPRSPAPPFHQDGALIARLTGVKRSFVHRGALFAATKWTNLYFPLSLAVVGDLVGGPVRESFGSGIEDVAVPFGKFGKLSAHVEYFNVADPGAKHLVALRDAVGLVGSP